MTMHARIALLLPVVLAIAGCGKNPYFSDDEGAPRPEASALSEHPDALSLPYALGTSVRITVEGGDAASMTTWRVESATPAVFTVDKLAVEDGKVVADCTAVSEGAAEIRLLDDGGSLQRSATVSVRAPDAAEVLAHAPLRILGRNQDAFPSAKVSELRVLAGGQAVYAVTYSAGGQRVYGRGILSTNQQATVDTEDHTTSGVAVNEWLFVHPQVAGAYQVELQHGATTLLTLPLAVVTEQDIQSIALLQEQPSSPNDGDKFWLATDARDAGGRDVYGVYSSWTLGGAPQSNDNKETTGDLYRYVYGASAPAVEVAATHGTLHDAVMVHATSGTLYNTTFLGCSAAPGGRSTGGVALAAAVIGLLALRRRRAVARG